MIRSTNPEPVQPNSRTNQNTNEPIPAETKLDITTVDKQLEAAGSRSFETWEPEAIALASDAKLDGTEISLRDGRAAVALGYAKPYPPSEEYRDNYGEAQQVIGAYIRQAAADPAPFHALLDKALNHVRKNGNVDYFGGSEWAITHRELQWLVARAVGEAMADLAKPSYV